MGETRESGLVEKVRRAWPPVRDHFYPVLLRIEPQMLPDLSRCDQLESRQGFGIVRAGTVSDFGLWVTGSGRVYEN